MCVYVLHMCLACTEARQRASDPLELELKMVVNRCVGAGNRTGVLVLLIVESLLQTFYFLI